MRAVSLSLILAAALAMSACKPKDAGPAPVDATPAADAVVDTGPTPAASVDLPEATTVVSGRTAVISLPYRTADRVIWVSANKVAEAEPFAFKSLDIKPGAGPGGSDLAVFTYEADKAGKTHLKFGLVPPGKMLIGPDSMVYKGPVSRTYETDVEAK